MQRWVQPFYHFFLDMNEAQEDIDVAAETDDESVESKC